MSHPSNSYSRYNGVEDCLRFHSSDGAQPCWGEVEIIDTIFFEDSCRGYPVYYCKGHEDLWETGEGNYLREDLSRD